MEAFRSPICCALPASRRRRDMSSCIVPTNSKNRSTESGRCYESIDLIDAVHPQTILAYEMNGEDLSVGHGAPRHVSGSSGNRYKQAEYIMRIELVDSFAGLWGRNGGYWEDRG